MASSSEAFEKFWTWRNSRTWLNVTVKELGQPEHKLFARISGIDEDASLVGVVGKAMHSFSDFDVGEAEFSVEHERVIVSRACEEWLIFEVAES